MFLNSHVNLTSAKRALGQFRLINFPWHAALPQHRQQKRQWRRNLTYSVIQLVLAVQWFQIGEILLEDVDVRLQERLSKSLEKKWHECLIIQLGTGDTFSHLCMIQTCMAAVNWASFSMVSSEGPLWTLVKTDVLKKYLQFWWSIWYNNSNISALTSGEDRYQ